MDENATPNEDLKKLERLIGSWEVTGEATGTVTYSWLNGGFFLKAEHKLEQGGQKVTALEVIGHNKPFGEAAEAAIRSRNYDNFGNTLDFEYEVDGDTLTIWGGTKGSPAYYKGTFDENDVLTGAWVYPGGGGYSTVMKRV